MKKLHTLFMTAAFVISFLTACHNPTEKGKGNYHKDAEDTVKKVSKDSTSKQSHVNPEDTIRKY